METFYGPAHEFDEERDTKIGKCWVLIAKHSVPAWKPLKGWEWMNYARHGFQYAGAMLSLPGTIGWDTRMKNGYFYLATAEATDEEQKEREPIFRERIAPWIDDFGAEWKKLRDEVMAHFERLKKVEVQRITDIELLEHYQDYISVMHRSWEIHFVPFYAGYYSFALFEDICKELIGIDAHHPQFTALMSGFDNALFEADEELWRLGDRAKELGLEQLFQTIADDEELLSELEKSETGRKWLEDLDQFLQEYGWRGSPMYDVTVPSWIEKPSLALPNIRRNVAKGGTFVLRQERERLVKQREEAERDVLSRVPGDKREWFEKLMKAAQWSGRYSEDHTFYLDMRIGALGRRVTKEIGNRFARAGIIEDPEDIYFLFPEEISVAAITFKGRSDLRKLVQRRKEQRQEMLKIEAKVITEELLFGDLSVLPRQIAKDPSMRVDFPSPMVRPELKADLYGTGSAPGVAEGIARVVMSEAEFGQVQPGDILVTAGTSPTWIPLFNVVKAVVTDSGGFLCHSVIIGREYGLAVVAGCIEATRKLKTGMKVRVDGDNCSVYILEG